MVDGTLSRLSITTFVVLAPLTAGCAHVGEDEFDATIAEVRQEIVRGDRAVEARLGERIDDLDARLDALETEFNTLEENFAARVERLETAIRITPPIHFAFDDATLRSPYLPVLDQFAQVVRNHEGAALITVEGFTDPAGSEEYNRQLGMQRAESVRRYLVEQAGLDGAEIRTVSYGETQVRQVKPGEAGPGAAGWENRRVALVVDFAAPDRRATIAEDSSSDGR